MDFLYLAPLLTLYLGFNFRRTGSKICSNIFYCTGTALTHRNSQHPRSIHLGYLTGSLTSVKNLNWTTYRRGGHLCKLQYVYIDIERESVRNKGTREINRIINRRIINQSRNYGSTPSPRRSPRPLHISTLIVI